MLARCAVHRDRLMALTALPSAAETFAGVGIDYSCERWTADRRQDGVAARQEDPTNRQILPPAQFTGTTSNGNTFYGETRADPFDRGSRTTIGFGDGRREECETRVAPFTGQATTECR